jgi:endonuclease/exonuclease/phosphatase family metal-dependent hydrolase
MLLKITSTRFGFLMIVWVFLSGCGGHKFQPIEMLHAPLCENGKGVSWAGNKQPKVQSIESCRSVGTIVLTSVNSNPVEVTKSGLALLSWNKHEDFGDLEALLRSYNGTPLVILVQEVARVSVSVPHDPPATFRLPKRIGPRQTIHRDIVTIARDFNLSIVYLPSMPNGFRTGEDRGNAILSTLPISDVIGVELPWGSQRRVAIVATLTTIKDERPYRLRVVNIHLDNRSERTQQASALIDFLSRQNLLDLPIVIGGDLNSWFGVRDNSVRAISKLVPYVGDCGNEGTFRLLGLHLDHLFTTLPENIQFNCFIESRRFGSDHYPVVLKLFKK